MSSGTIVTRVLLHIVEYLVTSIIYMYMYVCLPHWLTMPAVHLHVFDMPNVNIVVNMQSGHVRHVLYSEQL